MNQTTTIQACFGNLTDPRNETHNKRHKLIDILTITILAVICGADSWVGIERFGNSKEPWLKTFLELPNGIPSHDTFGDVFARLDSKELQMSFLNWIRQVFSLTQGEIVAIDGKTLCGSYDDSEERPAIHMINAWACKNRLALGQLKTETKSNEITAVPELLKLLDLKGCTVTLDAMHCQKETVAKIVEQEADYVIALKGNQGTLHADVTYFLENEIKKQKPKGFDFYEALDGDHGRIESRRYWITNNIDWIDQKEKWKGLASIGLVEYQSEDKKSKNKLLERRFFICSIEANAKRFAEAVRYHWHVENSLHWCLDVGFSEDDCRIRKDNAPENLAVIRQIALNLLKQEKTAKVGIQNKRLMAGWDDRYLAKVLMAGS